MLEPIVKPDARALAEPLGPSDNCSVEIDEPCPLNTSADALNRINEVNNFLRIIVIYTLRDSAEAAPLPFKREV